MSEEDYILEVKDEAARAVSVIRKLANKEQPLAGQHMPNRELQQCAGLAFTFVKKAGAVVTVDSGHGFVLAKIKAPDGSVSWSAPLFISLFSGGLGMTLGFSQIDTVVVLDTPEAVGRYAKSQWDMRADMTEAGPLGKVGGHDNLTEFELGKESFSYSVASGAILDISLKGMRYNLDSQKNLALYGADATPQAILEGRVKMPLPVGELHEALTKYMQEGQI